MLPVKHDWLKGLQSKFSLGNMLEREHTCQGIYLNLKNHQPTSYIPRTAYNYYNIFTCGVSVE